MTLAQPLTPLRWIVIPALQVVVATWLFTMPLQLFGLRPPEPVFAMVLAFAWAVIRPSVLAPFCLLLLGIGMDLLWGSPLGLWSVAMLIPYGAVLSVRNMLMGQQFPVLWLGFAVACGMAELTGVLVTQILAHATPQMLGVFYQWGVTVALYPLAHRLIERFDDADVRFR